MADHRQPMLTKPSGTAASGMRAAERIAVTVPRIGDAADPDVVVDQILKLLGEERFQKARALAAQALARFPQNARVQRAWGVFDRLGKTRVSTLGPQPSADEELEWLKHPPEWARGKWVALVDSRAVAAADTLDELMEAVGSEELDKKPLAVRIDG